MSAPLTKIQISAGAVLINPFGKIAVVSQHNVSWSLPKGKVEPGESILVAALREVYEETGIKDLQVVAELGYYERHRMSVKNTETKKMKQIHLFIMKTNSTTLKPIDPHNPIAQWVDPEKVPNYLTFNADKEFYISKLLTIKSHI